MLKYDDKIIALFISIKNYKIKIIINLFNTALK
jgi:hypothetical protein